VIRLALAAALLAGIALFAPASASPSADSRSVLSATQELLERASREPPQRDQLVQSARAALEAEPELAQNEWLREPLQASPANLEEARARLAAAQAALDLATISPREPAAARASLDHILSNPPIKGWSWLSLVPDWLLPLLLFLEPVATFIWNVVRWPFDRFLELIGGLLEMIVNSAAIVAIGVAIALALVLLLRRGLRAAIVAQSELTELSAPLPPTSGEAVAIAQRHAQEGRFREACHYVFLSTLLWIEERGQAEFQPAATNREYLAQIASQPLVARALRPVVSRFDRVWYGQDQVTEADYRDLLVLADELRAAVA
jgi:hypothetical protein